MPEFRLTQISDTHLARRLPLLTENFHRVSEHIAANRPDLVVNSGDIGWDGPTSRADLEFAKELHASLPVNCRYLPGNHDIGDNPTAVGPVPSHLPTEKDLQSLHLGIRRRPLEFEAAGWCFVGLNSLIMNTGLPSEAEQMDWLASQLSGAKGKPVALFLHKPLFLNTSGDPELAASAVRYIPQPVREKLVKMFGRSISGSSPAATCISAATSRRPHPPRLVALYRLHHSGTDAASDRRQGNRARGISLPARQL